ncbi:hypothetical protein DRZ78_04085, partial [Candidatus Aerophobetes bacterium]
EVERLCEKVAIINEGRLLAEDKMENIRKKLTDTVELEVELSEMKKEIIDFLASFDFVKEIKRDKNVLSIKVKTDKDYRAEISKAVSQKGGIVLGIRVKEMSLEEAFITITQKNISLLASNSTEVTK